MIELTYREAEAVGIAVCCAGHLSGPIVQWLFQHPQTPEEIITWLEDTVAAWNEDPNSNTA